MPSLLRPLAILTTTLGSIAAFTRSDYSRGPSAATGCLYASSSNNVHDTNINSRRAFLQSTATSAALVVATAACTGIDPAQAASAVPATGVPAPKFSLPNSQGTGMTTLDTLTKDKKWTVLYFYPGAFTNGCTLEARNFQKDLEEYQKRGTQIVGVSVDSVEKNAQFCTAEKLDFYMLSDVDGEVSKTYGSALSVPGFGTFSNRQTYIIDPSGDLRWVFTDVESHVSRHSAEVLDKLKELQSV